MPIPKKTVKISLERDNATKVTAKDLQDQLKNIGLDCKYTSLESLEKFKNEVLAAWPQPQKGTSSSAYGIYTKNKPLYQKSNVETLDYLNLENQSPLSAFGFINEICGEWKPSDTAMGYREELFTIQYPLHFDYLLANRPSSFTGKKDTRTSTTRDATVEAIKKLFIETGKALSSIIVNGLNKTSLEPIFANALKMNESDLKDNYEEKGERVIYLVQNYNEGTKEADGVGVLSIDWYIYIKDYAENCASGKPARHDSTMTINVRSVLYTSLEALKSDYEFVRSHFKTNMFLGANIPPRPAKLEVFDKLPPACKDTFLKGLPTINDSSEYLDTIILYAPDVQLLHAMDNSDSDASTNYSKSVTRGFTFSTSQTLSTELSFEATCEVIKTGFKLGISVSFTEAWNTSVTETVSISVPAKSKAFAYQGYMCSAILRYYAKDFSYSYISKAKCLTPVLKTTAQPVDI